ncbi:MAG: class I SAM-dependent methyltransferase family protein [Candidatus Thermoplasmatota archaeon]
MFAAKVKKEYAEKVRKLLEQKGLIDRARKLIKTNNAVEIPVISVVEEDYKFIERFNPKIITQKKIIKKISIAPLEEITRIVDIPQEFKRYLPNKWEKLGDVLIMKIPKELESYERAIASAYARVLGAKTVVKDLGIYGKERKPEVEKIFGESTETTHIENKIKFKLDVAKIMFSSGNLEERKRMANISNSNEVVVDMFAGIGYFSIPLAFYSKPKKLLAYEINPIAYKYLCDNIKLNKVQNIMAPRLEDCLNAEEYLADRVIMGYLKNTFLYLPKALRILKSQGGVIHYHENSPNELLPKALWDKIKNIIEREKRTVEVLKLVKVKSYAPGVTHAVLDLKIR